MADDDDDALSTTVYNYKVQQPSATDQPRSSNNEDNNDDVDSDADLSTSSAEQESIQEGSKRRRLVLEARNTTLESSSPSSPAAAPSQSSSSVTSRLQLPSSTQLPPPPPQRGGRRGRTWRDDFGLGPSMLPWGPEPLSPGYQYTAHETVKAVVSLVRAFLGKYDSIKSRMNINRQPPAMSLPATPTVEQVLEMVDQFADTVHRETIGLRWKPWELERRMMEFQVQVIGVDPSPSWFGLMNRSSMAFWEYLNENIFCETIDPDPLMIPSSPSD